MRWGCWHVRGGRADIYVKPVACFTRNGNDESFRALRRDRAALHPLIYRCKTASDSHGGYREPIFRKPAPNPKERDIYRADLKYKVAGAGCRGMQGPQGACSYFLRDRDRYALEFQSCTKDECGSQYKNSPRKHSWCKWHGNNLNVRYVRKGMYEIILQSFLFYLLNLRFKHSS